MWSWTVGFDLMHHMHLVWNCGSPHLGYAFKFYLKIKNLKEKCMLSYLNKTKTSKIYLNLMHESIGDD